MARATRVLTADVWFGEGPRWRDGRLWFSDFAERSIRSLSTTGELRTEVSVGDSRPSGLGWTPNGDLLFVAVDARQVRRVDGDGGVRLHADLDSLSSWPWNDMVVDQTGRAYVGEFGFNFNRELESRGLRAVVERHATAKLACIQANGAVELAADGMHFPNGSVITPDGKMLIVAESLGCRLTAFDIGGDGALSNKRLWAPMGRRLPDGICLDADGAIWFASAFAPECVRVAYGGQVLEVIDTGQPCFACMLGGDDGRSLFMLTAHVPAAGETPAKGQILVSEVETPHAGWP